VGLNTLANHGFLPRNGKFLDFAAINSATTEAYNFANGTFAGAFAAVFQLGISTTGDGKTFHLEDLKKHDAIEFDGSISRNDFYFGDDLHFDPRIWSTMARYLKINEGPETHITVDVAGKARNARVADAKAANPQFNASAGQQQGSPGTTALYLLTNWDDEANAAPKSWVKSFFEKEQIAYNLGFNRPTLVKTMDRLAAMAEAVGKVTGFPV
jgi:hypothetical protein